MFTIIIISIQETVIFFRERFKSETVNDMAYFLTLLIYIHQNPVKAGMVSV